MYPLSALQKGLLFHAIYTPNSPAYLIQYYWRFEGKLNVEAMQAAWAKLIQRHTILRTSFSWEELENPVQIVHKNAEITWIQYDWTGCTEKEQLRKLKHLLAENEQKSIHLNKTPSLEIFIIKQSNQCHQFIMKFHHILMDGWSLEILLDELVVLYNNRYSPLANPAIETKPPLFKDFIVWLEMQEWQESETFWKKYLENYEILRSWNVSPKNEKQQCLCSFQKFEENEFVLDETLDAELQLFAKNNQLTLNALLQGAWAYLESYYTDRKDLVLGITVSTRPIEIRCWRSELFQRLKIRSMSSCK